ncbi:PLP-dependent aminotransferase family protein [Agromyces aureus]|uniref:MocR-like pyridoxine biosynthesis transcription factor PdxR n=1 Tax=Agromyces aureus TaxID=453304 RepID=UPI0018DC0DFC|nr:PLP-dependent aminotransferase family protein [Agromyces aureus]
MDLHVVLDPRHKVQSLERALRDAIDDGSLAAGTRLPASRALAADLGIARNSVVEAYERLLGEGRLEARVGSGTRVRERIAPSPASALAPVTRSTRFELDLRGGLPDASAFPRSAWLAAMREALAEASSASLGYGPTEGVAPLRAALAEYLARARGVRAQAGDVIVTHGFGELLALVARAIATRGGRRIAVEAYGHVSHREVLEAAGLELVPLAVDAEGVDVARLHDAAVDAVLLTPAHQFPTGVPLSSARRASLAEWAATGGIVIEDDYDGEFRFDGRSIGAFQSLAPDSTVYGGTASKALSPAVGIGWGVVPPMLRDGVLAARRRTGAATDAIGQAALAVLVASGGYDRSVRTLRTRYRARRERFEGLLAEGAPDAKVLGLAAGLHCLLELPEGVREEDVVAAGAERGLRFDGLAAYAADRATASSRPPTMVVGFGAPPDLRFEQAVAAVIASIDAAR